jgi:hypothetical protein
MAEWFDAACYADLAHHQDIGATFVSSQENPEQGAKRRVEGWFDAARYADLAHHYNGT